MPAAAALPRRMAVGRLQNNGAHVMRPHAAIVRKIIAATVLVPASALPVSPTAPISIGMAVCQRRSRWRSPLRPTNIITTMATPYGMAVSRPM